MQTTIRQLLVITSLFSQLTTFAQNGPPTVEQVRAAMNMGYEKVKTPLAEVSRTEVRKVWTGSDSIPIQIYYPNDRRNLPIIYNVHGGALVWAPALDMNIARVLCMRTGSVVVSVDYRLAPEHPFPAAINDSYAVWQWIDQNAERIQGNRQKLMLIGDSAGGLFIGGLQVKRQQESSSLRPSALIFINPAIDMRPTAAGVDEYALVSKWYLNGADPNNPIASPVLAATFKDFPPSLIITSEKDALKPHGLILAEKLKEANVPAQLVDLPGLDHLGHTWLNVHPTAKPAVEAVVSFINSANARAGK